MRHTAIVGLPAALALLGCAHLQPSPPAATPAQPGEPQSSATAPGTGEASPTKTTPSVTQPAGTGQSSSASPQPSAQAPASDASKAAPQPATPSASAASQPEPTGATRTPPSGRNSGTAPPGTGAATPPRGPKPTTTPGSSPSTPGASPPSATNSAPPTDQPGAPATQALDLTSLEQRLKDTRAIGLFTKLSLKNQVDDLLTQFRAFHAKKTPPLSELRQRYDLLLLKVLSLLQDGDPPLAAAISGSRESLWSILTDPQKFARL